MPCRLVGWQRATEGAGCCESEGLGLDLLLPIRSAASSPLSPGRGEGLVSTKPGLGLCRLPPGTVVFRLLAHCGLSRPTWELAQGGQTRDGGFRSWKLTARCLGDHTTSHVLHIRVTLAVSASAPKTRAPPAAGRRWLSPDCRQGNRLRYLGTSQEGEGEGATLNLCPTLSLCLSAALWDFALSFTEDREIKRSFPREDRDAAGCDWPQLPKPVRGRFRVLIPRNTARPQPAASSSTCSALPWWPGSFHLWISVCQ